MKSLSKLHQEAIIKAQNETDQNKAAALAMIETPIEMIKAIMLKHEIAVIEVMRELQESREAAVMAEREECALLVEKLGAEGFGTLYIAACIRLKGEKNGDAK